MTKFGLDSNILVYFLDDRDLNRRDRAREIVDRAGQTRRCTLSVQNLGEFFAVATRKSLSSPVDAQAFVAKLATLFPIVAPTVSEVRAATAAAVAGRFSYWDALLLATLGAAGCSVVLSEDMHDGAALAGVTVRNPFVGEALPGELDALLS